MSNLAGLMALIPATGLLTVSFFVLFAVRKVETQGLKVFGYIVAVLLWTAAFLVFSSGIYTMSTGRTPMCCMMQEMKEGKMHRMMGEKMMMKGKKAMPEQPDASQMKH